MLFEEGILVGVDFTARFELFIHDWNYLLLVVGEQDRFLLAHYIGSHLLHDELLRGVLGPLELLLLLQNAPSVLSLHEGVLLVLSGSLSQRFLLEVDVGDVTVIGGDHEDVAIEAPAHVCHSHLEQV